MRYRVTDLEVSEIIDTTLEDLSPFIAAANAIVTSHLEGAPELGASLLKEIERWLSAHFVAIRDPRVKMEQVGTTSSIEYVLGTSGFDSTPYGVQAVLMDVSGRLKNLGKARAEFKTVSLGL